jgi:hypothetical protein
MLNFIRETVLRSVPFELSGPISARAKSLTLALPLAPTLSVRSMTSKPNNQKHPNEIENASLRAAVNLDLHGC